MKFKTYFSVPLILRPICSKTFRLNEMALPLFQLHTAEEIYYSPQFLCIPLHLLLLLFWWHSNTRKRLYPQPFLCSSTIIIALLQTPRRALSSSYDLPSPLLTNPYPLSSWISVDFSQLPWLISLLTLSSLLLLRSPIFNLQSSIFNLLQYSTFSPLIKIPMPLLWLTTLPVTQ